jgi:chromate transporter
VLFREVRELDIGPVAAAWPVWPTLDPWAAALALVAALCLFWLELGMLRTLGICGVLGIALRLLA